MTDRDHHIIIIQNEARNYVAQNIVVSEYLELVIMKVLDIGILFHNPPPHFKNVKSLLKNERSN